MVKKRMAMKMVTIFVALIVCGMFFPDLARGEDLSSDQGPDVDFEDVVIGEDKTIPLQITNQSESKLTLLPTFNMDADCDFTCNKIVNEETTELGVTPLEPDEVLNLVVTFSPSEVGTCIAWLDIMYTASPEVGMVTINFTANGVEEAPVTLEEKNIKIGGVDTGVPDRAMDEYGDSTLGEMIGECEATAYTCGQLLQCVSRVTWKYRKEKLITAKEMYKLRKVALSAEIRKIVKARKTSRRAGGRRFPNWWWHND